MGEFLMDLWKTGYSLTTEKNYRNFPVEGIKSCQKEENDGYN